MLGWCLGAVVPTWGIVKNAKIEAKKTHPYLPLCNFATIALYITCSSATLISPTGPEIHPSAFVLCFHSIASSLNTLTLPLMDNHELPADMVNLVIETLVTPCSRCRKSYSAIFTKQNVCTHPIRSWEDDIFWSIPPRHVFSDLCEPCEDVLKVHYVIRKCHK